MQTAFTTSLPTPGGLNSEIGMNGGFASVSATTLKIYSVSANSTCSINLGGPGMGLVEAVDGTIYAYNGKVVQEVNKNTCVLSTHGNVRTGNDNFFVEAPKLIFSQGKIIAAGRTSNAVQFEEVLLAPALKLGRIQSVALPTGQGKVVSLIHSNGSRFVLAIETSAQCYELKASSIFL
jgi:hypothetical protein